MAQCNTAYLKLVSHVQRMLAEAALKVHVPSPHEFTMNFSPCGQMCRDCIWRGVGQGCPYVNVLPIARACKCFHPKVRRDTTP